MPRRLLVIGAGPKGVALAAKARVLSECGYSVPEVKIIEKNKVAANWEGGFGYTDGYASLETPPEKDIGFPYSSKEFRIDVDLRMFRHYSWHSYLIDQGNHGLSLYSEEVDRGPAARPTLKHWAGYLQWAAKKCQADITLGEVTDIKPSGDHWTVTYLTQGNVKHTIEGDGVVITGPGPAKTVGDHTTNHRRVLDGYNFWNRLNEMESIPADDEPIGVVGSGGAAASVIMALARKLRHPVPIAVVNRGGAIFSRGESYWEKRVFSDPDDSDWDKLPLEDRLEFIKRTDRGVFSLAAIDFINRLQNIHYVPMEVKQIEVVSQFELEPEGRPVMVGHNGMRLPVRYAIIAIGFDPWWFWRLISDPAVQSHLRFPENQLISVRHIQRDLAFHRDRVPSPPLHVPMLASATQGPGFPNLSCLGHLSDRILSRYVQRI